MVAPYHGRFKVTQIQSASHDGLDLVGIDSKTIYCTVQGTVIRAGWENPQDHSQGWGLRVAVKETNSNRYFYFGHLSSIAVSVNQSVSVGTVLGIEGSTGYSTGSHLHYCARLNDSASQPLNISQISGIPNQIGIYDSGETPTPTPTEGNGFLVCLAGFFKKRK